MPVLRIFDIHPSDIKTWYSDLDHWTPYDPTKEYTGSVECQKDKSFGTPSLTSQCLQHCDVSIFRAAYKGGPEREYTWTFDEFKRVGLPPVRYAIARRWIREEYVESLAPWCPCAVCETPWWRAWENLFSDRSAVGCLYTKVYSDRNLRLAERRKEAERRRR